MNLKLENLNLNSLETDLIYLQICHIHDYFTLVPIY